MNSCICAAVVSGFSFFVSLCAGTPAGPLQLSAQPTVQEIFRARVFEEPLVPIGGEPTTEENAALAAVLLGYAKRRCELSVLEMHHDP